MFNLNVVIFKFGQVVKYCKVVMCKMIIGWWFVMMQNIVVLYNYGDVVYIWKFDYVFMFILKIGIVVCKQVVFLLLYCCWLYNWLWQQMF